MGNCCSHSHGDRLAIGGTAASNSDTTVNVAVDHFLKCRGYNCLSSQIELSLSASRLRDRDVLSKSDPMAVIYMKKRDGTLVELGRTEVILNSLNPVWITKHNIAYHFEFVQTLVIHVYDVDTHFHKVDVKLLKLEEQQFLGEAIFSLSEVVTKTSKTLSLKLACSSNTVKASPQNCGELIVHAEEWHSSKTTMELIFRCSGLANKDLFSKSDPFLILSRKDESGISIPICKTEVIKNDLKPAWKPIFLNTQQVGSKDTPIDLECYNFNNSGKHDLIGKVHKSLTELEKNYSQRRGENLFLPITAGHDCHNKILKSQLFVDKFSEHVQHTFLDYIAGGFELNFMVAVDFTASNGNPRLPDSLHYIDPSGRPNAYQHAILEAGQVLEVYDSDRQFPAWGFGAQPIDGPISHCFNLNGSGKYCEVEGVQGILNAYASALLNVSLAGPTLFGPVITNAAQIAGQCVANGGRKYFILLIITDGVITDLHETKNAIVKASDLPMSILIVGVGGADFKEMEALDGDKERLTTSSGRVASRDIVQFVPLRVLQNGVDNVLVFQSLLAELPAQFLSYMRSKDILPHS